MKSPSKDTLRWFETPVFYRIVYIATIALAITSFYFGVFKRDNDFQNHYILGQEFLQGSPYCIDRIGQDPVCTHYPLGRLMLDTVFAALPYTFSRMVNWIAGIVCLVLSLKLWNRLSHIRRPAAPSVAFAAAMLSLGITLGWLLRDLDDCGQQLLLLMMLTGAAWTLTRGKSLATGALLGLAVTYKATPLLFFPLLLYKRRWSAALSMVVTIVLLNGVAPALFIGWTKTLEGNRLFFAKVKEIQKASADDPTANAVEPPRHVNRSLRMSIARYLMTVKPGDPLFLARPDDAAVVNGAPAIEQSTEGARPHPLFVQFLDLSPKTASQVVTGILLLLALGLAIRFRRPWGLKAHQADLPPEWTAVMILCAILSPLCWGQHMVLLIPAVFLILREQLSTGQHLWRLILIWLIVLLMVAPQRELFGRNIWLVLHSYKLDTMASLLILLLVLTLPKRVSAADDAPARGNSVDA